MLFFNAVAAGWVAFKSVLFKKHVYVVVAILDDFYIHQYAKHISVEAIAPVLNMSMNNAVEEGYMTIKPTPEEQVLLDQRKAAYEEKQRKGEL